MQTEWIECPELLYQPGRQGAANLLPSRREEPITLAVRLDQALGDRWPLAETAERLDSLSCLAQALLALIHSPARDGELDCIRAFARISKDKSKGLHLNESRFERLIKTSGEDWSGFATRLVEMVRALHSYGQPFDPLSLYDLCFLRAKWQASELASHEMTLEEREEFYFPLVAAKIFYSSPTLKKRNEHE